MATDITGAAACAGAHIGHAPSEVARVYVQGDQAKLASGAAAAGAICICCCIGCTCCCCCWLTGGPASSAATLVYSPSSAASCRKESASMVIAPGVVWIIPGMGACMMAAPERLVRCVGQDTEV
eukprot:CAMPEP_0118831430 /NCGR_PEP_ID=MMETSP1162-20130426/30892_1 /TAXON_ID=33656 /ORGANISM="Phaeocystis Sp, Strain CCMP2710" /LENGTH=123 /DNA_ID=CAMNT_0006762853 /DNA_START=206 /DNA_END=574 /DNA_ORIENTATION=-